MEDIRVLRNELIETRRLVLIQLRTVYYVDYDEKKVFGKRDSSPEEQARKSILFSGRRGKRF